MRLKFLRVLRPFSTPKLEGHPVVVLSSNDGRAVASSVDVKALGVKMGTPRLALPERATKRGVLALSSNDALYADTSNCMMSVPVTFSTRQEIIGQRIRTQAFQWVGSQPASASESPGPSPSWRATARKGTRR